MRFLLCLALTGCVDVAPAASLANECGSGTWSPYHVGGGATLLRGKVQACPVVPAVTLIFTWDAP